MKIAVDAMGGDKAPQAIVEGTRDALAEYPFITRLLLVGDEGILKSEVDRLGIRDRRLEIVHCTEVVGMGESPVQAIRKKKDSSISVSVDLVKQGECEAVVSAGNTGAAVAASTIKLRNLKGVDRAGIASPLPNEHGPCNIVDAGANVDAKPGHLLQYAIMGSVYARHVQGKENPVVGLMSVGEEEGKGTDFTREVFDLLKASHLNFRGNVEGHDLFETKLDVVVCDGFTGNIVLKSCEATAKVMFKWLKHEINSSPFRQLGALMAKGAFRATLERGSYETYGGSPLLGVNGICIIAHGSSSARAAKNAIRVAAEAVRHHVNPHIEEEIERSGAFTSAPSA
ncbi:MAG: phosphate acyltransferase PlsX [Verrucomicrobiae bacterium]|nr:phosphate acyltransferase PlsX [Verrucomicrobiae bacterium]MCB1090695.1 phosphate acyltransferase PlsX [Verrucomicrobiae bacterium]